MAAEVRALVPVDPSLGSTLAELAAAAKRLGIGMAPVTLDRPDLLSTVPLPAIAHLGLESHTGHYVVLLSIDAKSVQVLDGADRDLRWIDRAQFERSWTGYLLIAEPGRTCSILQAGLLIGLALLTGILLFWPMSRSTSPPVSGIRVLGRVGIVVIAYVSAAYVIPMLIAAGQAPRPTAASHSTRDVGPRLDVQAQFLIRPISLSGVAPVVLPRDQLATEELRDILSICRPYFKKHSVSVHLHQLRLWGPDARWPKEPPPSWPNATFALSGQEVLDHLLNVNAPGSLAEDGAPRLLYPTEWGVAFKGAEVGRVRGIDRVGEQAHIDQILAVLAEAGITIDSPVIVDGRRYTVRDLLADAVGRFSAAQELEFTAIALACYLSTNKWTNRFGQVYSFDEVADQLLARHEDPSGLACYGTHVPYALVVLLNSNEQRPLLTGDTKRRVEEFLKGLSAKLEDTQYPDGLWRPDYGGYTGTFDTTGEVDDWAALRVTGHTLEWIALAPSATRPNDAITISAIKGLQRKIRIVAGDVTATFFSFNNLSHCCRGLVMCSGYRDAWEAYSEILSQP